MRRLLWKWFICPFWCVAQGPFGVVIYHQKPCPRVGEEFDYERSQ